MTRTVHPAITELKTLTIQVKQVVSALSKTEKENEKLKAKVARLEARLQPAEEVRGTRTRKAAAKPAVKATAKATATAKVSKRGRPAKAAVATKPVAKRGRKTVAKVQEGFSLI